MDVQLTWSGGLLPARMRIKSSYCTLHGVTTAFVHHVSVNLSAASHSRIAGYLRRWSFG